MDNEVGINDAGLNSLSGFAYQIKVFIYRLTLIQDGQRVEFETLDDVAVTSLHNKDSISDYCLKWSADANSSLEVFQVKQTNVTESVGQQVLYNWLLAYNQRSQIEKFTLYIARGYSFTAKTFSNGAQKAYDVIMKSDKGSTALITRVKRLYQYDFAKFESDYNAICDKVKVEFLDEINNLINKQLESPFHATAHQIKDTYFESRVNELVTRICARIIESAGKRIPYVCVPAEYMQLCEEVCNNISPANYSPDYEAFSQLYASGELTEEIVKSREYRQLCHCNLQTTSVLEHLRWEQYYQNIRQHYLADAKKETISKIEGVAHQNHTDVVLELQLDDKDIPLRRLIKTKDRKISDLSDEYSRWGTYIFLTQDGLPKQISWKDEDGDIDEK